MAESGLMGKFKQRWLDLPSPYCKKLETSSLGFESVVSSFVFLMIAISISLLFLLLEKIFDLTLAEKLK